MEEKTYDKKVLISEIKDFFQFRMDQRFTLNMKINVITDGFDLCQCSSDFVKRHHFWCSLMINTETAGQIADV